MCGKWQQSPEEVPTNGRFWEVHPCNSPDPIARALATVGELWGWVVSCDGCDVCDVGFLVRLHPLRRRPLPEEHPSCPHHSLPFSESAGCPCAPSVPCRPPSSPFRCSPPLRLPPARRPSPTRSRRAPCRPPSTWPRSTRRAPAASPRTSRERSPSPSCSTPPTAPTPTASCAS